MKRWTLLLGLLMIGVPTMALAQEDREDMGHDEMAHEDHEAMQAEAEEAIEAAVQAWEDAFNAGDAEATADFFTEDGVSMPPGAPAREGRAAILASLQEELPQMAGMQMDFETTEVKAMHGHALEVGTYTIDAADGSHVDHGKYVAIWVKTDDGWKVARDIWNSDMAPQM